MPKFPNNPSDGMIVEVSKNHFYIYNKSIDTWSRLPGLDKYDVASQTKDGLMSKSDFKKVSELILPPPQTSLKGELCDFTYQSGSIGLYSGDGIINIKDKLTFNYNGTSLDKTWNLHFNTDGVDWTIDLDKLFNELNNRGKLIQRAIPGEPGLKGLKGESGRDSLDTGPIGEDGEAGQNAPWRGTVVPEAIKLEANDPNSNKAIVDITTEEISDKENYLIIKRAHIGSSTASTDRINFKDFDSPWVMALDFKPTSAQKVIESRNCNEKLVCKFSESSVYYVNMAVLIEAFEDRFNELLAQVKQSKEQIVIGWLRTMVTMFNQQKSAICCALENCRSRKRNASERKYIEDIRVQAAQAGLNVSLDSDKREIIDLNVDKPCAPISAGEGISSVVFGDENDCFDCAVTIILDGVANAGTDANAITFSLPAGEYVATIDDCCVNTSVIRAKWTGKVNIQYNHQVASTGGNSPKRPQIISTPDCGEHEDPFDAENAYMGTNIQFSHAGGDIKMWIPDTYPQDNEGSLKLCIRKLECYDVALGSDDELETLDDTIYVYRNSIEDSNLLGAILPFNGNEDAITNYGHGIGSDPNGASIINGCSAGVNETALFYYDGSDGLSFFTVNGNVDIGPNDIQYSYETINGTGNMSVLVSDDAGELIGTLVSDTFTGNWQQDGESDGGVIGYFDRRADAPWIHKFTPDNPGSIDFIKVCSRDGNNLFVAAPPGKEQNAVTVQGDVNYYDNPVGGVDFEAGDGLKFVINGAVGFGAALRGQAGDTIYSNRTTFGPDGRKFNTPAGSSTTTSFYVGEFFLRLQRNTTFLDAPLGLVIRFVYEDGTSEDIMPLTNESYLGVSKWGYESAPAIVSRDHSLVARHNSFFPSSPICDPDNYANTTGTGGYGTNNPAYFFGKPDFDEYCQRLVVSYIRMKKKGKVYFFINDDITETSTSVTPPGAGILSSRDNVGQYDVLIERCEAKNFDENINPIVATSIKNVPLELGWTTPFCESSLADGDALTSLIFTKIRDGCSMVWQKIEWYERGWRIGACCGAEVELNGQKWLIVKRSLDVDTTCGGGESILEDCIRAHIRTIGHPAIAWPSIDGDEFFGRPVSGSVTFVYDKTLSAQIVSKITSGDVLQTKGDPATNIGVVLFPKLD